MRASTSSAARNDSLTVFDGLGFDQAEVVRGIVGEAGENFGEVAVAEMIRDDFAEDAAVVGGDGEIALLVELVCTHAGPARVHFSAFHRASHNEHAIGVAMVGAAVAIFVGRAAEFGHAYEDYVVHAVAHILVKRGHSLPQIAQKIRKAPFRTSFGDVMIPAVAIEERDFEPDIGFEEFGNFLQAASEAAGRILRAVLRLIRIGVNFPERIGGFERLSPHAAQFRIDGLRIHGLEAAFHNLRRAVHFELFQVRDGDSRRRALER